MINLQPNTTIGIINIAINMLLNPFLRVLSCVLVIDINYLQNRFMKQWQKDALFRNLNNQNINS